MKHERERVMGSERWIPSFGAGLLFVGALRRRNRAEQRRMMFAALPFLGLTGARCTAAVRPRVDGYRFPTLPWGLPSGDGNSDAAIETAASAKHELSSVRYRGPDADWIEPHAESLQSVPLWLMPVSSLNRASPPTVTLGPNFKQAATSIYARHPSRRRGENPGTRATRTRANRVLDSSVASHPGYRDQNEKSFPLVGKDQALKEEIPRSLSFAPNLDAPLVSPVSREKGSGSRGQDGRSSGRFQSHSGRLKRQEHRARKSHTDEQAPDEFDQFSSSLLDGSLLNAFPGLAIPIVAGRVTRDAREAVEPDTGVAVPLPQRRNNRSALGMSSMISPVAGLSAVAESIEGLVQRKVRSALQEAREEGQIAELGQSKSAPLLAPHEIVTEEVASLLLTKMQDLVRQERFRMGLLR